MTYASGTFMGVEDQDYQERLSLFLHRQYAGDKACRLARDIDCTPKAAQNILSKHWPNARLMRRIVQRFGRDVLTAVFEPDIDPEAARLAAEVRDLEEQLQAKLALRRQVEGDARRRPRDVAAHQAWLRGVSGGQGDLL